MSGFLVLASLKTIWKEPGWLLVKMKDDEADARRNVTGTEPESVLSGRTLAEIKAEEEKPAEI